MAIVLGLFDAGSLLPVLSLCLSLLTTTTSSCLLSLRLSLPVSPPPPSANYTPLPRSLQGDSHYRRGARRVPTAALPAVVHLRCRTPEGKRVAGCVSADLASIRLLVSLLFAFCVPSLCFPACCSQRVLPSLSFPACLALRSAHPAIIACPALADPEALLLSSSSSSSSA